MAAQDITKQGTAFHFGQRRQAVEHMDRKRTQLALRQRLNRKIKDYEREASSLFARGDQQGAVELSKRANHLRIITKG